MKKADDLSDIFIKLSRDWEEYKKSGKITPLLHIFFICNNENSLFFICEQFKKCKSTSIATTTTDKALYYRFYRLVKHLASHDLLEVSKHGGNLIFCKLTGKALDLLKQAQNSNQRKIRICQTFQPPNKCRPERIEAIKEVMNLNILTSSERELIKSYYNDYIEVVKNYYIVLERRDHDHLYGGKYLVLKYATRFTSSSRKAILLKKYDEIIKKSLLQYKEAVHLVLTTDPKLHKSLWHANRHFAEALNQFFSFLRKRLGYRPPYLAVYEFTHTGLLHAHVLIFGVPWLIHHRQITEEWQKCNQGQYNYIYALKNDGTGWHYKREKPKDIKEGEDAGTYLRKYLKKAQYNEQCLFLYWVFGKSFFTYARVLAPNAEKPLPSTIPYQFLGVFAWETIPDIVIEEIMPIYYPTKPPPPKR